MTPVTITLNTFITNYNLTLLNHDIVLDLPSSPTERFRSQSDSYQEREVPIRSATYISSSMTCIYIVNMYSPLSNRPWPQYTVYSYSWDSK